MKKNKVAVVFTAVALHLLVACLGNKKLTQANAETAIKSVIEHHNATDVEKESRFNLASVVAVRPVSQFSETEASAIVKFKDAEGPFGGPSRFALKFIFQKNVDNRWILTRLEKAGPPDGADDMVSGNEDVICAANQNLSVVAQ